MNQKISVHIINESSTARNVLQKILELDPLIKVLHVSSSLKEARDNLEKCWPDVFLFNIEIANDDGLLFLREITDLRPTPAVLCTSQADRLMSVSAQASWPVAVIVTPPFGITDFLTISSALIIDSIKSVAKGDVSQLKPIVNTLKPAKKLSADVILSPWNGVNTESVGDKIIAIGASAGGTQALEALLPQLPENTPGIVIVQHMPENFTYAFAERLNTLCKMHVVEARDGDRVEKGHILVAPGNKHLVILRKKGIATHYVQINAGPLVSRHRPSVDVLFRSVSKVANINALGIILTGMGDDGALGMAEMKKAGCHTIAQNQATSVVFGMPQAAIQQGGVRDVLSLTDIQRSIIAFT